MPNAVVATTTSSSSSIQARWVSSRSALLQAGVVRPGAQAPVGELRRRSPRCPCGWRCRRCPGPRPLADLGQHPVEDALLLAVGVGVVVDLQPDLRPVEPGDDDLRVAHLQPLDDLGAHRRGGGRGEREHGRVAELLDDAAEAQVVGPEVVAPGGDAVRLVDDEQRRAAPRGRRRRPRAWPAARGRGRRSGPFRPASDSSTSRWSPADRVELSWAARPARSSISASRSTWSRCRAISGETTTTGPSRSCPATW